LRRGVGFTKEGIVKVARIASFEGVNAAEVQRTMADAEAIIVPMIAGLAGYQGHLQLVSPSGKVLSITLFDSEEHAEAAESVFDEEMPARLGDLFKDWDGRRVGVDRYMIIGQSIL
jgi:hypothetical protein